jgi:hypothetical protein
MVIEQVRSGRRVADVAASVEVPEGTIVRWVRQDKIHRGELPGASSQDSTERLQPAGPWDVSAASLRARRSPSWHGEAEVQAPRRCRSR